MVFTDPVPDESDREAWEYKGYKGYKVIRGSCSFTSHDLLLQSGATRRGLRPPLTALDRDAGCGLRLSQTLPCNNGRRHGTIAAGGDR
jgi:hypothetical protein